ncbi:AfsR/SARP family transcriptional regulator [Paractinoplanes brasiliensis]|uniref:DNA-binding SARP family transcriptional activator n=1 Tax=Paractinoplanes brasiliensis TaxID=52695 RepID=A0A4R6JM12_9ACTN|nr:AfsR/SARP family transcriptional regulator [Actinoplanes brasiliensis]TDO36752.1 DNA-binding SARP family transcriptional activator [Actinoplanes brasiliensis]GID32390.1 hypothetical protein Abr02nite_73730 [Actinoplanes brasiliensis]
MEYRILGPLEARREGTAIDIKGRRQLTVLAMLLVDANQVVPTDHLVEAVWGSKPPTTSRSQIHICVSSLRRQLFAGEDVIDTRAPGYRLRVAEQELDLHVFQSRVAAARTAVRDADPRRAVAELRAALGLWHGRALAGIGGGAVRALASRYDEQRLAVHEECLELELAHGPSTAHDLAGELLALVAAHPRRERLLALLMTALYRAGRQAEALDAYHQARLRLVGELGIEPGSGLDTLYQQILAHDPALAGPAAPPPEPVRAARTPDRVPRRLPAGVADFTGRRDSLTVLLTALERAGGTAAPTAVVSGRGGVGKTTLAVHAAHLLAPRFPDGQLFARLSGPEGAENPHDVLGRFLRAYGQQEPDIPDGVEERAETYRDLMADRRALVILDDALTESQVFPLLPGTSRCRVIVTSRRPLPGLAAGVRLRLAPFTERSALELGGRIAGHARIDADRAAAVALNETCGYLPLALRLAAARLAAHPHWTVADLVARLGAGSGWLAEMEEQTGVGHAYASLSDDAGRLFRLLPLVEAADFPAWVGAPLLDVDVCRAEALFDELADADLLVARPAPGGTRYWVPGWILGYARRLQEPEHDPARRKSLERLLGALLYLSELAHRRRGGHDLRLAGNGASRWELPGSPADLITADPAAWYGRERPWVLRAVRQATAAGFAEHAWGLAMCTVTFAGLPGPAGRYPGDES